MVFCFEFSLVGWEFGFVPIVPLVVISESIWKWHFWKCHSWKCQNWKCSAHCPHVVVLGTSTLLLLHLNLALCDIFKAFFHHHPGLPPQQNHALAHPGPQKSHIYFFWCLCTCLMGYYAPIHGSKVKKSKDMTTTFLFVVVVAICNTSLIHTKQLSLHICTFLVSNWFFFVKKHKHIYKINFFSIL